MKVSVFMRPGENNERHLQSFSSELDTDSWPENSPVNTGTIYDVLDKDQKKIGEVSGELLDYLVRMARKLDLYPLIDSFWEGIVVIDMGGRICFANTAYSRIIGVPLRIIMGKSMYVIEPEALLLTVLREGVPMRRDRHVVKTVNKTVSMRMYPILRDGQTVGAYSIFRDVTDLHRLDQEVKRITEVAEEYISQENVKNELEYLQIITEDTNYHKLIKQAITAAQTDATILINGENGSGKEIFTKLIHANSLRKNKPFIAVNCAAIPETLIESELFGYEAGAFTGAKKGGKVGKFQLAQGGTLFLDEVGDMPLMMQTKLLRALQEGEVQKVGSEETISVDVRVIAATNQPLIEMIREKKFREDLYYRLNVISFTIPPLRERKGDILLLANQFLQRFNSKYEKNVTFNEKSFEVLLAYDWPGNVRELQNCIESCVIMSSGGQVTPEMLPSTLKTLSGTGASKIALPVSERTYGTLKEETEQFERAVIHEVLAQYSGDQDAAIKHLGISLRSFYRKR